MQMDLLPPHGQPCLRSSLEAGDSGTLSMFGDYIGYTVPASSSLR